jgi:general L-amino acid transport system permease protein
MSDIAADGTPITAPPEPRRAPITMIGPVAWAKENLFRNWWSTAITLAMIYLIVKFAISFVSWAFLNAVWVVPVSPTGVANTEACRAIKGIGACWAVITEKHRFILFGTYPYDEHWRPLVVCFLFIGLFIVSAMRRFWRWELALVWIGVLTLIGILMWGGILGMPYVPQERWGGLPITLILATFGLAFAFPLAILVALGRRSSLPAIKALCVLYVELIRGVPLISLLFMASVMFPLFLPEGTEHRQAAARAGRDHPLRRRLSGRGGARAACRPCRAASTRRPRRSASAIGRRPASSSCRRRCAW